MPKSKSVVSHCGLGTVLGVLCILHCVFFLVLMLIVAGGLTVFPAEWLPYIDNVYIHIVAGTLALSIGLSDLLRSKAKKKFGPSVLFAVAAGMMAVSISWEASFHAHAHGDHVGMHAQETGHDSHGHQDGHHGHDHHGHEHDSHDHHGHAHHGHDHGGHAVASGSAEGHGSVGHEPHAPWPHLVFIGANVLILILHRRLNHGSCCDSDV